MVRFLTVLRPTLHEDARALLLLAAIVVIVFWRWLFAGQTFYWGDIGLYFLPLTQFLNHNLQQGTVPLWNPYLFCGTPFVGNPQAWTFYPATALLSFLSAPVYLMAANVLHLWLAGFGLYYFLRRGKINLDFYPSIVGAVVYMLGGFLVSKTQFPNMVQALAYVPIVLLCVERLITKPTTLRAVALGVVVGLQLLAAHAQITVLTFYLLVIYAVACLVWQKNLTRQYIARIMPFALPVMAVALGLSCVFWLPVLELMRVAERQNLGIAEAHRFYLLPREVTNLFWPMRFGGPLWGSWSAPGNFWEKACYMGIVPCLLALAGIRYIFVCSNDHQRQGRFWLGIFFISLLLALGWQGGLFVIAYYAAPGIKLFHDPARMLLGAAIAIPVLAALGLHGVLRRLSSLHGRFVTAIILLLTVIDLAYFAHSIYPLQSIQNVEAMKESRLVRLLREDEDVVQGQARMFFADPQKNRHSLLKYQTYYADDPQFLSKWSETIMPNLSMLFDLPQVGGYEPVAERIGKQRAATAEATTLSNLRDSRSAPEYSRRLAAMSVKYLVIYGPQPLQSTPGLVLVAQGSHQHQGHRAHLYRNTFFQPRAHWAKTPVSASTTKDVILSKDEKQSPDVVEFRFRSSPHRRRFILTDSAYAGWTAYLNREPVSITPTADGLRSVEIPASTSDKRNRLVFVYQPATFSLAFFISVCTLMLLGAFYSFRHLSKAMTQVAD